MSTGLLYRDELRGFARSKVMIVLFAGLPVVVLLLHFLSPDTGEMPLATLSAVIVSTVSGTLSSVMLTVSIIQEKSAHVYELFLIRPIRRRDIILAKFLAVYTCVAGACILTIVLGLAVDAFRFGGLAQGLAGETWQSLATSLSMTAISGSAGILIGVAVNSVLLGVILVIYGANQMLALVGVLPVMLEVSNAGVYSLILGVLLSSALLVVAAQVFNRKQF
jgi:ABC-2 type transport system permease protein